MYKPNGVLKGNFGVLSCTVTKTKTNKNYIHGDLIDLEGNILQYKMWECDENIGGKVIKTVADIQEYNGTNQAILRRYTIDTNCDVNAYRPRSPFKPEFYYEAILRVCKTMCDEDMYNCVDYLFDKYRYELLEAPGAKKVHHAYEGGLLEHLYETQQIALSMSNSAKHDMNLIVAAAALHDLGKLFSYKWNGIEILDTKEGKLIGHITMGLEILNTYVSSGCDLDCDTLLHLKHIILSHHGKLEWGSPVVPMSPEAYIVHNADNVGSKLNIFETERPEENGFTGNKNFFLGTELYYGTKA